MLKAPMQNQPLLVSSLIEHASAWHPHAEIVSRTTEETIHRCTYADLNRRAKQLAGALTAIGVKSGARVATLAWNGYRHMELYYAVSGMGAVLHTIDPRLPAQQIEYVVNHAEDQFLFFDATFMPLLETLASRFRSVKGLIVMTDIAHTPLCRLPGLLHYEELLAEYEPHYEWPVLDENAASSLCYTSGATGHPTGVLYSHRSTVLHAFAACAADALAVSTSESVLLAVPMFHAHAWGMPYAGAMSGAKLVLAGPTLDGASLYQLMRDEQVTLALGAPTVWLSLFAHVDAYGLNPKRDLRLKRVVIGGAAAPRFMSERFTRDFDATPVHTWGVTEKSPLGAVCNLLLPHTQCST